MVINCKTNEWKIGGNKAVFPEISSLLEMGSEKEICYRILLANTNEPANNGE